MERLVDRPSANSFVTCKLSDYRLVPYATPEYLDNHPPIRTVDDLAGHRWIDYVDDLVFSPQQFMSPLMGSNLIITVFAVVVIGGMGSIIGSIVTGLSLGVIEGIARVFYPELSATVVFILMALVLLVRPSGLFGKEN